jgi:hypothetical protein
MKKIIILVLLFTAVKVSAQKAVLFKMEYEPQRTYNILMNIKANINADLSGNAEIIDKLKQGGFTLPLVAIMSTTTTGTTKTGALAVDKSFPIMMSFQAGQPNMTLNGKSLPLPMTQMPTTTIYAHVLADGRMIGDSVSGKKTDTSGKKALQMMNTVQKQIKFPNHRMHVGDTFTQDMPMNLAGNSVDSKVVYTLVNIADGKAFFDMVQTIDMKLNIKQGQLAIAGSGTGKMIYSIKDNMPVSYISTVNMTANGDISSVIVKGTMVMDLDFKYDIN